MLRVDHSYGHPLEMPSVILSERRMYNAKTRIFQAKAKIRANSKDTNKTNLTAGNASVNKEVKFFTALEQTVETRKEDSNDRECIVVTDLSKNPTERKYLRRFIESIRQTGTMKEDFIINRVWETSGARKCLRDRQNSHKPWFMIKSRSLSTQETSFLPMISVLFGIKPAQDTQICEDYRNVDTATNSVRSVDDERASEIHTKGELGLVEERVMHLVHPTKNPINAMYYRLSLVTIILSFTVMLVSSSPVPAVVPEAQALKPRIQYEPEGMRLQLKLHMCIVYHSDL
ncbi:uncharacterized protein ARMOST_01381 [Armillaria ostoyae]|uniref:Uncharacterized protein n=1 Tax=Armillaria ostoyae TaxID=47428 RepID=A0A284QNV2_ARMOS|nr:uncharacterized protein ARMOST_01381 [Armillaria ostoyae]